MAGARGVAEWQPPLLFRGSELHSRGGQRRLRSQPQARAASSEAPSSTRIRGQGCRGFLPRGGGSRTRTSLEAGAAEVASRRWGTAPSPSLLSRSGSGGAGAGPRAPRWRLRGARASSKAPALATAAELRPPLVHAEAGTEAAEAGREPRRRMEEGGGGHSASAVEGSSASRALAPLFPPHALAGPELSWAWWGNHPHALASRGIRSWRREELRRRPPLLPGTARQAVTAYCFPSG